MVLKCQAFLAVRLWAPRHLGAETFFRQCVLAPGAAIEHFLNFSINFQKKKLTRDSFC